MSTGLTGAEVDIVRQYLADTTNFRVFPLLAETILWSIFTVLITVSSYILISRGLNSRQKRVMFTLTLVMYVLSTVAWAMDVRRVWTDLKITIPADLASPRPDTSALDSANTLQTILQAILTNIVVMFSDMVVCWRVCVVYNFDRRVILAAAVLLFAVFVNVLMCNLIQIGVGFPSIVHLHVLAPAELPIDILAMSFCSIVNIWATSMLAWKAWQNRREIRAHLLNSKGTTFAEAVLALFIDSGIIYTVLWILKSIIIIPRIELTAYTNYAEMLMYQIVGMYPTVVLVLVALQRSHLESQFTYAETTQTNISVRFAQQDCSGGSGNVSARTKGTAFIQPKDSPISKMPSSSGSLDLESNFEEAIPSTLVTVIQEREDKDM